MTHPVVVGTDLSESADEALRQAHDWSRQTGAPLVVCHAMPDLVRIHSLLPHLAVAETGAMPALEERVARAVMDRATKMTGRSASGLEVLMVLGSAAAELLRVAEERQAELLVVGSGDLEPLERALLGATAEQVVRHAHCSVLVARRSAPSGVVLAATDFSKGSEAVLEAAATLARRRGAKLSIMHSIDVAHPVLAAIDPSAVVPSVAMDALRAACRETLEDARSRFQAMGDAIVAEGPAASAIARIAHDIRAELVVVGTRGTTGWRRIALGSVAAGVLRRLSCSVLVVRA